MKNLTVLQELLLNNLRAKGSFYCADYYPPAKALVAKGLAEWNGSQLQLTDAGRQEPPGAAPTTPVAPKEKLKLKRAHRVLLRDLVVAGPHAPAGYGVEAGELVEAGYAVWLGQKLSIAPEGITALSEAGWMPGQKKSEADAEEQDHGEMNVPVRDVLRYNADRTKLCATNKGQELVTRIVWETRMALLRDLVNDGPQKITKDPVTWSRATQGLVSLGYACVKRGLLMASDMGTRHLEDQARLAGVAVAVVESRAKCLKLLVTESEVIKTLATLSGLTWGKVKEASFADPSKMIDRECWVNERDSLVRVLPRYLESREVMIQTVMKCCQTNDQRFHFCKFISPDKRRDLTWNDLWVVFMLSPRRMAQALLRTFGYDMPDALLEEPK